MNDRSTSYFTDDGIISCGDLVKDTINSLKSTFIFHSYAVVLLVIKLEFTTSKSENNDDVKKYKF